MRGIRQQLWAVVLVCSGVLIATLSAFGQEDENKPDKIGRRTVAHRSMVSPEKEREIGTREAEPRKVCKTCSRPGGGPLRARRG
jgi:hypothetical protein